MPLQFRQRDCIFKRQSRGAAEKKRNHKGHQETQRTLRRLRRALRARDFCDLRVSFVPFVVCLFLLLRELRASARVLFFGKTSHVPADPNLSRARATGNQAR
jgi:hypothetical protein